MTPPATGVIEIERGGDENITINHGCGGGDCGGGGNSGGDDSGDGGDGGGIESDGGVGCGGIPFPRRSVVPRERDAPRASMGRLHFDVDCFLCWNICQIFPLIPSPAQFSCGVLLDGRRMMLL